MMLLFYRGWRVEGIDRRVLEPIVHLGNGTNASDTRTSQMRHHFYVAGRMILSR
jgi:hypothetical protein